MKKWLKRHAPMLLFSVIFCGFLCGLAESIRSQESKKAKVMAAAVVNAADKDLAKAKAERDKAELDLANCQKAMDAYRQIAEQCVDEKIRVKR